MTEIEVTMVFRVEHTDECYGDVDEFVAHCASWAKEDPVGWILSRFKKERLPEAVQVRGYERKDDHNG